MIGAFPEEEQFSVPWTRLIPPAQITHLASPNDNTNILPHLVCARAEILPHIQIRWPGVLVAEPRFEANYLNLMPLVPEQEPVLRLLEQEVNRTGWRIERMVEEMALVNEVSREIAAIHDLEQILKIVPERLTEIFGYYHASVGVINQHYLDMYEASKRSRAIGRERFRLPVLGPGMVPWVAREGQVRLANDTHQDEFWTPGKGLEASKSELTVPVLYRERVIGTIDVQSEHRNAFDQNDISILEALAGQLAIAIENARLYEENRYQRQVAETLSHLSRLAGSMLDIQEVAETVLAELADLLKYDTALIALLQHDTLRILRRRSYEGEDWAKITWLVEESPVFYQVIHHQETLLIPDAAEHRLWFRIQSERPIRCWAGVPLVSRGKPIGVLAVGGLIPRIYEQSHCNLLFAFANQIAASIDNARLFERIERREHEARALYEMTRLLVSLDQDAIPVSVINKLEEALPYDLAGTLVAGNPSRVIIGTKRFVDEHAIGELEHHLLTSYNAVSSQRVSADGLLRRVVITGDVRPNESTRTLAAQLSVPLIAGRNVIGLIELRHSQEGIYSENDLRTLYIIANSLATALENARLYQELSNRAAKLQHAIDELAEADRLKDEMVENISHELRTPLTYMQGYLGLLLAGEMGELLPEQRSSLQIVEEKTKFLARLVSDLVLLDNHSNDTNYSLVNLAELAERVVQANRAASSDSPITLVSEIDGNVPLVRGNAEHLVQVIENLVSNALKFTPPEGTIHVRVFTRQAMVRMEVEDTGIGIAQDKLERIFERFYQVYFSPRRRYRGVGLGLAVCKQIIHAHHGQIGATSQEGVGSLFYFELPQAETSSDRDGAKNRAGGDV